LGSASKGTISELGSDGTVKEFVHDEDYAGKVSVNGVKVDRKRNRVIAAVTDIGAWNYSGVAAYDLDTKKRLFFARLDSLGVAEGEKSCANDVAVDSTSGDVYVTNCVGNFLWKVTTDGSPSVFVKHENFTSQPISPLLADSAWSWVGFNGIVYLPQKYLLVVQTNTGALFRVGVQDRSVHVVLMKEKLPWADGLVLREDGTLVVVSKEKVWLVGSASDWMAANVVDVVPLNAADYTTAAAMKKRATFVVHTHLQEIYDNQTREEFEVREIEFPAEFVENDPWWLIVLIVVIVVGVSLWRFQVAYVYQQYRRKNA
jgi:DNA-binding beta-propeller fold protein YncE